jgi:predicted metal-dependent hydrolase
MTVIRLGAISIAVTRKPIKHTHLSVYPPDGRVTLVAPTGTRVEVMRAYAVSRLGWIRRQQARFHAQARETPRRYLTRETHWLWGRRYLLAVEYADVKPSVTLDHKRIRLRVRPGSDREKRAAVMHAWHKAQLHAEVVKLIAAWEPRLNVHVKRHFLQRMKTRWGSCNRAHGHIRLNTELVKKPKSLLEYVVVHEMVHLRVPDHGDAFVALMDAHYPRWRGAQSELNALPLAAEAW